jgi:hypothetical protein
VWAAKLVSGRGAVQTALTQLNAPRPMDLIVCNFSVFHFRGFRVSGAVGLRIVSMYFSFATLSNCFVCFGGQLVDHTISTQRSLVSSLIDLIILGPGERDLHTAAAPPTTREESMMDQTAINYKSSNAGWPSQYVTRLGSIREGHARQPVISAKEMHSLPALRSRKESTSQTVCTSLISGTRRSNQFQRRGYLSCMSLSLCLMESGG